MKLITVPNVLTLGNLFCGLLAIMVLFYNPENIEASFPLVGILLGISLLLDFLDGLLARALKQNSEMGVQLDSLADVVSFGVVPGFLLLTLMSPAWLEFVFSFLNGGNHEELLLLNGDLPGKNAVIMKFVWQDILPSITALLIPLASALRLAKFNISGQKLHYFLGLPTPANTIMVYALAMAIVYQPTSMISETFESNQTLAIFIITVCYLLLSNIPLFSFKMKGYHVKKYLPQFIFIPLLIGLVSLWQWVGLFLAMVSYIVISIVFRKRIVCQ